MSDHDQMTLPKLLSPKEGKRVHLPDERQSVTHKFTIFGGDKRMEIKDGKIVEVARDLDAYMTAGMYPDGKLGEIFLNIGKEGGVWKVYDAFAVAVSVGLQYGIPIEVFIEKFEHARFEPAGVTNNPDIGIAKSIPDYIFRWLKRFVKTEDDDESGGRVEGSEQEKGSTDRGEAVPVRQEEREEDKVPDETG